MTIRELIREMNKLSDEEQQCEIVIGEINDKYGRYDNPIKFIRRRNVGCDNSNGLYFILAGEYTHDNYRLGR